MMKSIIKNQAKEHYIQNYKFKILSSFDSGEVQEYEDVTNASNDKKVEEQQIEPVEIASDEVSEEAIKEITPQVEQHIIQQIPNPINEEMLKKIDELSSNVVKLQMKLEKQEDEFSSRLANEIEVARKNAYEEGLNAGKSESENKINELSMNVANSIKKLEAKCEELGAFCEKSRNDLNEAAFLIAKEVVGKELSDHSEKIALSYAKTIMADIDKSVKIRISVNPKDYEYIKNEISSNRIEVISDDAINKGCLVINSDTLNTQISIKERLAQARSMILDEE